MCFNISNNKQINQHANNSNSNNDTNDNKESARADGGRF